MKLSKPAWLLPLGAGMDNSLQIYKLRCTLLLSNQNNQQLENSILGTSTILLCYRKIDKILQQKRIKEY